MGAGRKIQGIQARSSQTGTQWKAQRAFVFEGFFERCARVSRPFGGALESPQGLRSEIEKLKMSSVNDCSWLRRLWHRLLEFPVRLFVAPCCQPLNSTTRLDNPIGMFSKTWLEVMQLQNGSAVYPADNIVTLLPWFDVSAVSMLAKQANTEPTRRWGETLPNTFLSTVRTGQAEIRKSKRLKIWGKMLIITFPGHSTGIR